MHHLDGLAAVLGTLQRDVYQVTVVDALARAVCQLFATAPGRLAHSQLVLVDEAHHLVGVRHLRYLYLELQRAVVVELQRRPFGVVRRRTVAQLPIARMAVSRIGDKSAAIGGSPAAHN